MNRLRVTAALASALLVTTTLGGCALLEAPKQSVCDALYAQVDQTIGQLGGVDLSVHELEVFLDELETQHPEVFAEVREGNFSALLNTPDVDIEALERATGIVQLSEIVTPENLAVLDGVGGSLMSTVDQIRTVCS